MTQEKLNGSADLLAKAIRKVFEETSENVRYSVKEDMHEMEKNLSDKIDTTNQNMESMEGRLNDRIDTTNENMQVQFAEQEEKIAKMVRG